MTAREIADRYLLSTHGPSPERLQKTKVLAVRSKVPWPDVETLIVEATKDS